MKIFLKCLLLYCFIIINLGASENLTLDKYINKAEQFQKSGNLEQSVKTLEEATTHYPDSASSFAYLGLYLGIMAGQTQDFMKAGSLIERAFNMLDKSVSLDSTSIVARFHRGLLGIQIPEFLGKLEPSIKDLEFLIRINEKYPKKVPKEMLISIYDFLATGYQKNNELEKAKSALNKIIEIAPGTPSAKSAEESLKRIFESKEVKQEGKTVIESKESKVSKKTIEKEPNKESLMALGKAYYNEGNFTKAKSAFEKIVNIDTSDANVYKWLGLTVSRIASKEYDERIYSNTNVRTNLVFTSMEYFDKAVSISPDDINLRYLRGTLGIEFPFFVGKLEQSIQDLKMVINSDAPDSIKAIAYYSLGFAYRKRGTSQWLKILSEYPESRASEMVFKGMKPDIAHLNPSDFNYPFVSIEFTLGFKDELEPQTAVWIEDKNGNFIKTLYVSGFSGYVKEKQVNLPGWAKSSKFIDTDAVTGASIGLGSHIYIWDLKNTEGKKVKSGEYIIKVEVSHWPSMKYQVVSANIKLGNKEERAIVEEGNLIPYLEVRYYP